MFTSLKLTSVEDQLIGCIPLHFQSGYVCARGKERQLISTSNFSESVPLLIQPGEKGMHILNPLHLICTLVKFRLFITIATHVCVCILLLRATGSQLKHNYAGCPIQTFPGNCFEGLLCI